MSNIPDFFKPFDRVLVRDNDGDYWEPELYGYYEAKSDCHSCLAGTYAYCIPYEGNEDLLGTKRGAAHVFRKGEPVGIWGGEDTGWIIALYDHFDAERGWHCGRSYQKSSAHVTGKKCLPASEVWPEPQDE